MESSWTHGVGWSAVCCLLPTVRQQALMTVPCSPLPSPVPSLPASVSLGLTFLQVALLPPVF